MKRAPFVALGCLLARRRVVSGRLRRSRLPLPIPAKVDAVFARWTSKTPGCAVGVSRRTARRCSRRPTAWPTSSTTCPNAADTIFEAGSVSKQFTAAAVLLLARDGKLSLDDPARKYVPELPDYGTPLTIRHMLTHTSGLRDWGEVAGDRRLAAHVARLHPRPRARHRLAAEVAELRAGHALVLQQHRLQPGRDHRVARERRCRSPSSAGRASSSRSG